MSRNLIFISHANPEDNVYVQWLATRLASIGYAVWSDVTKLLGGETFWDDIEFAIRHCAAKVVLVCSNASITKEGVKNELAVANATAKNNNISDFVIPLRIDGVNYSDFPIEAVRLNAIDFTHGWRAGFTQLVRKLEKDEIVKSKESNVIELTNWARSFLGIDDEMLPSADKIISNQLPICSPYPHVVINPARSISKEPGSQSVEMRGYQISLASKVGYGERARRIDLIEFVTYGLENEKHYEDRLSANEAMIAVQRLLEMGIEIYLQERGLLVARFSQRSTGYYYPRKKDVSPRVKFRMPVTGETHSADLTGESRKYKVFWHYAPQFGRVRLDRIASTLTVPIISHIVFTEDGVNQLESTARSHTLRRSYCKNWWQDRWRNLMLAYLSYICGEDGRIHIPVGTAGVMVIDSSPLILTAPVSAKPPRAEPLRIETWVEDTDSLLGENEVEYDEENSEDDHL